jgi:hypothetical protein
MRLLKGTLYQQAEQVVEVSAPPLSHCMPGTSHLATALSFLIKDLPNRVVRRIQQINAHT